jgi:hypothetical protein
MSFNLKLPDERGKQLQMIAEAEGKSVVDVITDHIHEKIAAGVIGPDLPYVAVCKTQSGVTLKMPDFEAEIPGETVPALTLSLREVAAELTPADVERKKRLFEGLAALSGIKVERMAKGVRLISPFTGKKYPLSFGVAADLADQIDRTK